MTDFLEINEKEKTIKSLNLEDLSIDNLKQNLLGVKKMIH